MDFGPFYLMYIVLTAIVGLFALLVLYKLKDANLQSLVMEGDGSKASLSRFQALIFTFVIAGLFLVLSIEHGGFVEVPTGVLGLLGISIGGYTLSKGIQNDKNKKNNMKMEQNTSEKVE